MEAVRDRRDLGVPVEDGELDLGLGEGQVEVAQTGTQVSEVLVETVELDTVVHKGLDPAAQSIAGLRHDLDHGDARVDGLEQGDELDWREDRSADRTAARDDDLQKTDRCVLDAAEVLVDERRQLLAEHAMFDAVLTQPTADVRDGGRLEAVDLHERLAWHQADLRHRREAGLQESSLELRAVTEHGVDRGHLADGTRAYHGVPLPLQS